MSQIENVREILRRPFDADANIFELLKSIEDLIVSNRVIGQEFVLRVLSRRSDFKGYQDIVESLIAQIGLFPYLDSDNLTLKDTLVYELHRPLYMENVVFHESQALVYYYLLDGYSVILSAPTSYGKSLIIDSIIALGKFNTIAIVVPTIALIDETRKRLTGYSNQYKIITHPNQRREGKNIFVLTQERMLEILDDLHVDFFVIDEFYKLSENLGGDSRCQVLNTVFYRLSKKNAQFYLLGPDIENVNLGYLNTEKIKFVKTDYKTVVSERTIEHASSEEEKLSRLYDILQKYTESSIIYCCSPKSAVKLTQKLILKRQYETSTRCKQIAKWIRENYHPEWIFAKAIENGIGMHHGRIPRSLAQLCVKLFNEGALRLLVCTSSLIEGVNTTAKNVILFDSKISKTNIDYFTFNNICGRSGRMLRHFIGRVFMFKDPPTKDLPFVDVPIFTQKKETSPSILINIDEEDLSNDSKNKLKPYAEQEYLPVQVLRANSYIDLGCQIRLATDISQNLTTFHDRLYWVGIPTDEQLNYVCNVFWKYFVTKGGRVYGVSSGDQLYFRIKTYRNAKDIRTFIQCNIKNNKDNPKESIDDIIDLSLGFQRYWINFELPRYLRSLCNIANAIFEKNDMKLCNYLPFALLVENYFQSPYMAPFDEYGLPMQVAKKISKSIKFSDEIDVAIKQLRDFDVSLDRSLTDIEKYFVKNVQDYL